MTDDLLGLAESIAIQAGEYALEQRRGHIEVAATKSNARDIVTQVDRDTESLIRSLIQQARPNDAVFGEEGGGAAGTSGLTWIVDPIDGTVNFLYDVPQWAVSIAVVEGEAEPASWRPLAGAVFNPSANELFSADADGPAELNGRQIRANQNVPLELALVVTGFAYGLEPRQQQIEHVSRLLPQVRDLRRYGAASLDLCFVACGRADAYYEATTSVWDFAAGSLIAERAGAKVFGWNGQPPSREMVIAAPEPLFDELEAVLLGH